MWSPVWVVYLGLLGCVVCVVKTESCRGRSWGKAVGEEDSLCCSPTVHPCMPFAEAPSLGLGLWSPLQQECVGGELGADEGWLSTWWRTGLSYTHGSRRASCGPALYFAFASASRWPCRQFSVPLQNLNLQKGGLVCWPGSEETSTWICCLPAGCCNHLALGAAFTVLWLNVALCCLGFHSPCLASERLCRDQNTSLWHPALVSMQVRGSCPQVNPSVKFSPNSWIV